MIWSTDLDGVIGSTDGSLVYRDPADMKHFRTTTIGDGKNAVVMGRKTAESIGKPLKDRLNIVLSRSKHVDVYDLCKQEGISTLWVVGGAEIYDLFLPKADELVVTTFRFHSNMPNPIVFKPDLSSYICVHTESFTTESGMKADIKHYRTLREE